MRYIIKENMRCTGEVECEMSMGGVGLGSKSNGCLEVYIGGRLLDGTSEGGWEVSDTVGIPLLHFHLRALMDTRCVELNN